ncbi:MAG: hypothetical protein NTW20_17910, partial [Rhodobacterales bacterium]|nr:hypothetical protein [Rhodobacterales bacterium]
AQPLEFAVNNQHMNGGIAVDVWGQTSHPGVYAVGEAAGTHGVTRPGGAALNAGQVFGTRAAEHVAGTGRARAGAALPKARVSAAVQSVLAGVNPASPLTVRKVREAVQARMSDAAGILCDATSVARALAEARSLNAAIRAKGIAPGRVSEAARAVQWQQMALASEAVLTALDHYIAQGGGSRGARAILDPAGDGIPMAASGPIEGLRFRVERAEDRDQQTHVRRTAEGFLLETRENRTLDPAAHPFFERDWPAWLTGAIHKPDQG